MADSTPSVATSVAVTTTAGLSAVQAGQSVEWLFNSIFHIAMPEQIAMTLGAAMIPLVHGIYNEMIARVASDKWVSATELFRAQEALNVTQGVVNDLRTQLNKAAPQGGPLPQGTPA